MLRSIFALFALAAIYTLLFHAWKRGTLLTKANWTEGAVRLEIGIRKVPSAAHWWALPMTFVSDEYPCFRCELFKGGSNVVFSSQTVQLASFETVSKAAIAWDKQGEATIYFDNDPVLRCNAKGFWSAAR